MFGVSLPPIYICIHTWRIAREVSIICHGIHLVSHHRSVGVFTMRRFEPHEVRAIRRLLHSGFTGVAVAKAFRTSSPHVSLIKTRRLHANVPDESPYGRRNLHPVELLKTVAEVDTYYTQQE